ncbi:MAG: 16S rRNA (adenine(1518)-N(6)/adenine(1519)-N(6))-dimethyltransferase RsmA [Planctomycetaceae bacterium]
MKALERQTRTRLMQLFERHGIHPRHDLGQNFLIDLNLLDFIIEQAELSFDDVILEIGAGTGGLTGSLARDSAEVVSVEIDRTLHRILPEVVGHLSNVTLLQRDALKNKNRFAPEVIDVVREKLAADPERRLKLIANLPYNIASPVISNLVASDLPWERMVVTIQWEPAQRMVAGPGDPQYGSLSIWLQSQCRLRVLKKLPPSVFWPRPQVHSAILLVQPDLEARGRIADRAFFQDYLRRSFGLRRKLLRGVLTGMYRKQLSKADVDGILDELGLAPNSRAEELPVDTHVALANRLHARIDERDSNSA